MLWSVNPKVGANSFFTGSIIVEFSVLLPPYKHKSFGQIANHNMLWSIQGKIP
jgi:hypothetical protein